MRIVSLLIVSIHVVTLLAASPAAARGVAPAGPPTTLLLHEGRVVGEMLDETAGLRVYRGIPYAAPPVGDLRWRPPRPMKPWPGIRVCREFGPVCPQPSVAGGGRVDRSRMSEDCLTLNVWTAAKPGAKQPVMVWIHGGGHVIGAGSMPIYEGSAFARAGVVLVTINYRLGPLGWLGHPGLSKESMLGVSGNYGMLDQIEALRWVERNIGQFGGDPGRVTIFGESAGSVSVSCLMVCPEAKGLFHRGIAQSGGVSGLRQRLKTAHGKLESLETKGVRLAEKLGVADTENPVAALRAVPWERILEVARPTAATFDRSRKYGPVVDGWLLPDEPGLLWMRGKQHDVPFMAGSNADDGGVFSRSLPVKTPFAYRAAAVAAFGIDAPAVLEAFPVKREEDVDLAKRRLLTVSAFVQPARVLVRSMTSVESKAWLYHFSRVAPLAKRAGIGAAHGIEIPYVFGTLAPWMGPTDADRALAGTMRACWVRFAATGDPNGEGLPDWPAHEAKSDRHLEFGDTVRAGDGLFRKECDLFDRIQARRRGE